MHLALTALSITVSQGAVMIFLWEYLPRTPYSGKPKMCILDLVKIRDVTAVSNRTSNLQLELSNCGYEVECNYYENIIHSCKIYFLSTYYPQKHCSGCSRNTAADLSELPAPGKEGRPRHCQSSSLGEEHPGGDQTASDKAP